MSSILSSRKAQLAADRRGFTLMELLVSLMISSLLVTVIYQLMHGNSQYVRMQSAREEVQQNARAALDLVASDLRSVPPGGFARMTSDSVRFYQPRGWGVLCNSITSTSPTAWVIFPVSTLSNTAVFGKANWGIAVEQSTDPAAPTGRWRFVSNVAQQATGDPCAAVQPNLNNAQHLRLGFNHPAGQPFVEALGTTIKAGAQVMLFEQGGYDVAVSSEGPLRGTWIRRMIGFTGSSPNMQPLAGPVPANGGLRFTYLRQDGATETTDPQEVRQVRVRVVAQSRAERTQSGTRRPERTDTVTTDVVLRNVPN